MQEFVLGIKTLHHHLSTGSHISLLYHLWCVYNTGVFRDMLHVRVNGTVGKAGGKLLWFVDLLSAKCI